MAKIDSGLEFDKEENYEKMKARMGTMDSKQYTLRVPSDLYKKVKVKLAKEERSFKSLLVECLEEYIKK